jgi:hypothetical protein
MKINKILKVTLNKLQNNNNYNNNNNMYIVTMETRYLINLQMI